ncbi:MAG: adenylate/guanylate cyclase domain-containing protein [Holosporaceae bacterium]
MPSLRTLFHRFQSTSFVLFLRRVDSSLVITFVALTTLCVVFLIGYMSNTFLEDFSLISYEKRSALLKSAAQNIRGKLSGVHYVGKSLQALARLQDKGSMQRSPVVATVCVSMLKATPFLRSLTLVTHDSGILNFLRVKPSSSLFWHKFQQRSLKPLSHEFVKKTRFASQFTRGGKALWAFYDKNGVCFYTEEEPMQALEENDLSSFKKTYITGQMQIRPPYPLFFGGMGLTITYPLKFKNADKVEGALGLQMDLSTLSQLLDSNMFGSVESLFLMNEEGVCLAHPRLEKSFRVSTDGIKPQLMRHFNKQWEVLFEKRFDAPLKEHPISYHGVPYTLYVIPFSALLRESHFLKDVTLCALLANDYLRSGFHSSQQEILLLGFAITIFLSLFIFWMAARMTAPIAGVVYALKQMAQMNFNVSFKDHAYFLEIHHIVQSLKGMITALGAFGKFVPKNLVRQLMQDTQEVRLGGASKELTILFSDIKGFTNISEKLDPQTLVERLCQYFDIMTDLIIDNKGTVDKYIGDAVMAFWGAPLPDKLHAVHACQSVLACYDHLKILNEKLLSEDKDPLYSRFGLMTGKVVVGNIGSKERFQYTILGDCVNLASRLEGLNKHYGTSILVGETVYQQAKDFFVFRIVDRVAVKGKNEGVLVYELLGAIDSLSQERFSYLTDLAKQTEKAFNFYQQGDFTRAHEVYQFVFRLFHEDTVAAVLKKRCQQLKEHPVNLWDGVFRLDSK